MNKARAIRLGTILLLLVGYLPGADAQSPRESRDTLRACIDAVVARPSQERVDVDTVLAVCSKEYDAFMAVLDEHRLASYQHLIRDYITHRLGQPQT